MKKNLFVLIIVFLVLSFSACTEISAGYYRVENKSNKDITDFVFIWNKDGVYEEEKIELIPANESSAKYAVVFYKDLKFSNKKEKSYFTISYKIDGKSFDIGNSRTKSYDKNGNCIDTEAIIAEDDSVIITVFDDEYYITK